MNFTFLKNLKSPVKKSFGFLFLNFGILINTNAQAIVPAGTSCTSKDLSVVDARIKTADPCLKCTFGGDVTNVQIEFGILNKTGSTRTSFKVYGYLEVTEPGKSEPNAPIYLIDGQNCVSNVQANSTTYGAMTQKFSFKCGSRLVLKNVYLAWTDASPKSTCETITPTNISPKCGQPGDIPVNAGLYINPFNVINQPPCGSNASINIQVGGGTPSYQYVWTATNNGQIPVGQTNTEDLTNIAASGTYTVSVTDAKNCGITASYLVTVRQIPATPSVTIKEPSVCGDSYGTLTVVGGGAGLEYNFNGGGWTSNTTVGSVAAGSGSSYTVSVRNTDGCIASLNGICGTPTVTAITEQLSQKSATINNLGSTTLEPMVTIKTSPNPFNDQVRFTINSLENGKGTLDIYNAYGQKLKTIYNGSIKTGVNYFDLRLAGNQRTSELVYVFTMGTQKLSGKLIQTGANR